MPKIQPWRRMAAIAAAVADDDGVRAAVLVLVRWRRTGRGSGWQHWAMAAFGEEEAGGQGGCGWTRKRGEHGNDEDPTMASRRRKRRRRRRRRRRRKRPSMVNMVKRERSSTAMIAASERLLRSRKWRKLTRQSLRENQGDVNRFLATVDGDGKNGRRERERERAGEEGGEGWLRHRQGDQGQGSEVGKRKRRRRRGEAAYGHGGTETAWTRAEEDGVLDFLIQHLAYV